MTDTTAPLAVTMATVAEAQKALNCLYLVVDSTVAADVVKRMAPLLALARRCLEPDREAVEAVTAKMHDGVRCPPPFSSFKESEWKDTWRDAARAALAALVNPDGR